jgi:hypothetical protein
MEASICRIAVSRRYTCAGRATVVGILHVVPDARLVGIVRKKKKKR